MSQDVQVRFKIIITALIAGSLISGCGSEETKPTSVALTPSAAPSAGSSPSSDALKEAVQAYSDAFLTGEPTVAYDLLSERCRKRTTLSYFTGIVTAAKQTYGSALPLETYSAEISGNLARVTYTYSIKAINQESEPWTRENGLWHQDDC